MRRYLYVIVGVLIMFFLSACGSSSSKHSNVEENNTIISYDNRTDSDDLNRSDLKSYMVQGVAQKGELLDGTITLYRVDSNGNQGEKVSSANIHDKGAYQLTFDKKGLYLLLAKGHFFDEYLGEKSSEEIELYALVDMQNELEHININMFTSLQYMRVSELMSKGTSYQDALKISKDELKKIAGVDVNTEASQLDIYDMQGALEEDNKNLLLFSATFLKIANESDSLATKQTRKLSRKFFKKFYDDFRDDGELNGGFKKSYQEMKKVDKGSIWKRLLENLTLDATVPTLAGWANNLQPASGIPERYIPEGVPIPISSNTITEFKFWGTKINGKVFGYDNRRKTPSAMFIATATNSVILRFSITFTGSGTINIYAKSNNDTLLVHTKATGSGGDRSLSLDIELNDTLRAFIKRHNSVSFYAELGVAQKNVYSIPILADLSNQMKPNTEIQTATYKGECPNHLAYLNSNTFDAKMDIDGVFRGSTDVSYSDVCVRLVYNSSKRKFYANLKSGYYGDLATPIYRQIGDYNVSFFVENSRTDSGGINISKIEIPLPPEHSIHDEAINQTINPMGSRVLSLSLPNNGRISLNSNLPTTLSGILSDKYLHGKNLPIYFRLSDYLLNQDGLKFKNAVPIYVFKANNRFINNTERFSSPSSTPIDIYLKALGIETDGSIVFEDNAFISNYPFMNVEGGELSIAIKNSIISPTKVDIDKKVYTMYLTNCKTISCADTMAIEFINLENITNTKLYTSGATVSTYDGDIGDIKWGQKNQNAIFTRSEDRNAKIYIPGYELPTSKSEEITSYLQGTIDDSEKGVFYYNLDSNSTQEGRGLFAGINVGNLNSKTEGSLKEKAMSIALGDKNITILTHPYSRYYIRTSGVTGLFNDLHSNYPLIDIYGYSTTFKQFKFRVIRNSIDEFTKIDGSIVLAGKAGFDVDFKHLGIDCIGGLKSAIIETEDANISAWHTPTSFTTLDFENDEEGECSATKKLAIGHILKVASLKNKIGAKVVWEPNGTPIDTIITSATFNQLDGNVSKDNNISNDGYSIELGDLKLASSSKQDWIESNMAIGLPFWGATDMSVRMENKIDAKTRKETIITAKGELFEDGRKPSYSSSALMRNIKSTKYKYDVSKKWAGVFTFGLPVYYDSTVNSVPKFLGRKWEEDLIVMKANAGINYITPTRTAMSFGASADFEKLKGLKLHIDLNDPNSLKEIDSALDPYLHLGTPLEDTLGVLVENVNIGNRLLKDGLSLSMEQGAFLALKEAGRANPNVDPFEKLAQLNAEVYGIPVMLDDTFHSIFEEGISSLLDSVDSTNIREVQLALNERVREYHRLVNDLNETKKILSVIIHNNPVKLKKFIKKQAFGTNTATCSWENFSQKGFFKPVGTVTSAMDKINKKLQNFNISKITKFAKTASKYSGIDSKDLVSIANKTRALANDLNNLVNSQKGWVQKSFKRDGFVCSGMGDVDMMLNKLDKKLAPFLEVATLMDNNISLIYTTLTSNRVVNIMKQLEQISNQNIETLKHDITNDITSPIFIETGSLVTFAQSKIPNLSADEMRRIAVTKLFEVDVVHHLIQGIHEQLTPVADELNKLSSILFSGMDKSINKILAKVSTKINAVLSKATSTLDKIPISTASMDGYSIFYGDQLAQLHIGSEFKIKGKDKDSSFGFNAALDIKNNEINGSSGCSGNKSTGNLDAIISTRDITMPIGSQKLKVDLILLGVNIDNSANLKGIFGGISSKKGFKYNKFKLYNLALATGIGSRETYLGARANATLDDLQLGVSFLVGVVCNKDMIEMVMPKAIYEFITLPGGKFNGAMVFGEAQMPIWVNGCMLTVNARAKLGTWFLFGPPKTFGGIVGGGAFGKGLCIATLGGEIEILAQKSGDDVKFQGSGWGAAGVGWCDNSWSSVSDSRDDDWCGTGDAQFGARYHNGWELMDIKTSAVH